MKYSKQLIDEVKELFPNSYDTIRHAEAGNEILGRFLDDSCHSSIPISIILEASSLEHLKALATREKRKIELYRKWGKEWDAQKAVIN